MKNVSPARIRSDLYAFDEADLNTGSFPCIISVVSSLLQRVVARNERQSAASAQKCCVLHTSRIPNMSIEKYLCRIFKYVRCSPSVFVVAYAYIDRLIRLKSMWRITSANVHRLLITSVMLAAKFVDDVISEDCGPPLVSGRNFNNAYYAQIGGLTTRDINKLEIELLFKLDFRLQVTVSVFQTYCAHFEREVALGGGYQVERILRLICAADEGSTEDDSQNRADPRRMVTAVKNALKTH